MLPIQEVTYVKCYLYKMLPRQSVLYKMLLYKNVLYKTLLIRPELPPSSYLSKIERAVPGFAVPGFAVPPPHHVFQAPPCQLPVALLSAKYVFVREDASIPSLAPVYRGPYLKLEQRDKFFRLQIGSGTDVVSVDCLKPVFSDKPVLPALPPACRHPAL